MPAELNPDIASPRPGPWRWAGILMAAGFAPLLFLFFLNLWQLPEYQFFPWAMAAAGFFAWSRWNEIPQPPEPGNPFITAALLLVSFALLAIATVIWSPWLAAVAALLGASGLIWRRGGSPMFKTMAPALVMLAVIIPPPLGLDEELGLFLRSVATTLSSRALHLTGVPHTMEGHILALPNQKLLVEEACSGIHSLMFIAAFGLFYLLWKRRQLWCYAILIPAALALVVIGNVVRISLGAWLRYHDGWDILTGWRHEWLSIILVVLYIAAVVLIERVLPQAKPQAGLDEKPCARPRREPGRHSTTRIVAACCCFALLGGAGLVRAWEKSREGIEPLRPATSSLRQGAGFRMPRYLAGWTRLDDGQPALNRIESLGLSTLVWTYQRNGVRAAVALDYPISGYHDVSGCYTNAGWEILARDFVTLDHDKNGRIELGMRHRSGSSGALWFATMNEKGQRADVATPGRNFLYRLVNLGAPREITYRVQLLIVTPTPLDGQDRENAGQLFEEASATLFEQVLEQLEK